MWAREVASQTTDRVIAGGREIHMGIWNNKRRNFEIAESEPTMLRIATFYYPWWRASVNGLETEVGHDENGAITLPLDDKSSNVHLYFAEPIAKKVAVWSSVGTVLFILLCLVYLRGATRVGGVLLTSKKGWISRLKSC